VDVLGHLLAAQQAHHQRRADAIVIEVVAAQMGDRRHHPDLDHRHPGQVGRHGDRHRGHPADVGHETLGRGHPDVDVDDRGDGAVHRPAVALQLPGRSGLGAGQAAVPVDRQLQDAAQRAPRHLWGHHARHRADPARDHLAHTQR
jgi:hypothetical protein